MDADDGNRENNSLPHVAAFWIFVWGIAATCSWLTFTVSTEWAGASRPVALIGGGIALFGSAFYVLISLDRKAPSNFWANIKCRISDSYIAILVVAAAFAGYQFHAFESSQSQRMAEFKAAFWGCARSPDCRKLAADYGESIGRNTVITPLATAPR